VDECENDEVNVGVVKSSVYQAIENEGIDGNVCSKSTILFGPL
jgi:hypothetical protein